MAKKHAKNAGLLIPDVLPNAQTPAASRWLPASIRPLFLPRLIRETASGRHIDPARREAAHKTFLAWANKLQAGTLHQLNESQVEADFTGHLLTALGYVPHAAAAPDATYSLFPKWNAPGIGTADAGPGASPRASHSPLRGATSPDRRRCRAEAVASAFQDPGADQG
jgi:hypothetical protein